MLNRVRMLAPLLAAGLLVTACGGATTGIGGTASSPTASPSAAGSSSPTVAASPASSPPSTAPDLLARPETVAGRTMTILVDANGRTLYRWTNDTGTGKVDCAGSCAAIWPPFILPSTSTKPVVGPGVSGKLGRETNPDGKGMQITYNGWPLYYYANDKAPGDTTGQGVGGTWFVVTPNQAANM